MKGIQDIVHKVFSALMSLLVMQSERPLLRPVPCLMLRSLCRMKESSIDIYADVLLETSQMYGELVS